MGTGIVTARDENRPAVRDACERQGDVIETTDASRVVRRADDDEVIAHQRVPFDSEALLDEPLFRAAVVHHQHIRISVACKA